MKRNDKYLLKIIQCDSTVCCSIVGSGVYSKNGEYEPKGKIYQYRDKKKKRFNVLKKLKLWENGQILPLYRKLQ